MREPHKLVTKNGKYHFGTKWYNDKMWAAKAEAWHIIYEEFNVQYSIGLVFRRIDGVECRCVITPSRISQHSDCPTHGDDGYFALLHKEVLKTVLDAWNKE